MSTDIPATAALLFKNGYGMVTRTIKLSEGGKLGEQRAITISPAPSAMVHGTLWIESSSKTPAKIVSVKTVEQDKQEEQTVATIEDLLEANLNSVVELQTIQRGDSVHPIQGKLISVQRTKPAAVRPLHPGRGSFVQTEEQSKQKQGNLVLLETANGVAAVPLTSVASASFKQPVKSKWNATVATNSLAVEYISDGSATVDVKYLTSGITWAPSYHLTLHPDSQTKTVSLAAKAVVLNDAEGLAVEDLACVAGFPNIKFSSVTDPMTRYQTVNEFLQSLDSASSGSSYANRGSVMTQNVLSNRAYSANVDTTPSLSNLSDSDDLHFYRFKNVSLPQKERIYLPIFDAVLPYKDIYHCDMESLTYSSYRSYQEQNVTQGYQDVWHAIEIPNNTKHVWTTAPVMLTKGDAFTGQDVLDYTGIGSKALVNLTKALDVKVCFDESITNSKGTVQILGNQYQKDTVSGRFAIFNHKSEAVTVQVKVKLYGTLTEHSMTPKTNTEQVSNDVANGVRKVVWEVTVEPGKTHEILFKRDINRR